MSSEHDSTSRRRLLKSIGVTGLALGAAGTAVASEGDVDALPDASTSDEISTDGYWEYKCEDFACCSGSGCQEYRRYCADGDCSGWERSGCCAGDCGPYSC